MTTNLPRLHGAERDAAILDRVAAGKTDPIRWVQVTSAANGHTLACCVMAEPLSMDGVYIGVSGKTEQQIADVLSATGCAGSGCSLLTPKLADLTFLQRSVTLLPTPRPVSTSTSAWEDNSARVRAQLKAAGGAAPQTLVQTAGKHWVLCNELAKYKGTRAANYGWHFAPGSPAMVYATTNAIVPWGQAYPSVTPGLTMIEYLYLGHDLEQDDYSQTCTLASRRCTVDGKAMDLLDVMASAELAPLVSHQGVLTVLRQPGVPAPPGGGPSPSPGKTPKRVTLASVPTTCVQNTNPKLQALPAYAIPWEKATPSKAIQDWAVEQLNAYRDHLGTIIEDTVGTMPVIGQVQCHPPAPWNQAWHPGVSVYHLGVAGPGGKLVVATVAPPGWPGT